MYKDKTLNEKLIYNDALEYSAKWIENSARVIDNLEVEQFAQNIAMSLRASKFQIDIIKEKE